MTLARDILDRRAAAVDGLRAVAAVSVVGYHAWLYTLPQVRASAVPRVALGDQVAHELRLGLVLFFVLSGFLLYQPWVRSALSSAAPPRLGAYLLRRAARILPAYYLALAGSIILLSGLQNTPGVRFPPDSEVWTFGFFAQNFSDATVMKINAPMWTLAVEVMFYAALPVLGWMALRMRGGGRAAQLLVPLAFLAVGVAYNRAIFDPTPNDALWPTKILPAMAPYFACGMLMAVLLEGRAVGRRVAWALFAAGAALVVGDAKWAADGALTGSHDMWLHVLRDLPAAAGFALLIAAAARTVAPPRALTAAPVAWTGRVSYGVYLWHVPLLLVLRGNGLLPSSALAAFAVVLPVVLAVAAASWYAVERPLQNRARRATRRTDGAGRRRAVVAPTRA